jgi:hypothetical protein
VNASTLELFADQIERDRALRDQRPRLAFVGIRAPSGKPGRPLSANATVPVADVPGRVLRRVFPNRLERR